jgi:regulator of protease activity HflC (stomatin/prohibitin superfamily)
MTSLLPAVIIVLVLLALFVLANAAFTVPTGQSAIVQRFGRFQRVATPGLNFKLPLLDRVAVRMNMRVQQLDVEIESKTKDNVFVKIPVSIQYQVKPDEKVKSAMNDINAAQREQVAANARGEAEKILKVKQAEAEAASKALQGEGIANQRKAIIAGLQASVELFQKSVAGATAQDVLTLVMMTQYLDTLKELGGNSRLNTILVPHSPGGLSDYFSELRNVVTLGMQASNGAAAGGSAPAANAAAAGA